MISLFCAAAATKRRAKVARRRREAIAGQQLSGQLPWEAGTPLLAGLGHPVSSSVCVALFLTPSAAADEDL